MITFHNDENLKNQYLDRVRKHISRGDLVKGTYWDGEKGCSIGCTIHSDQTKLYELELGIPEWLSKIEDVLYEGMSIESSAYWPFQFLKSIPVGVNLENYKSEILAFVIERNLKILRCISGKPGTKPQIEECIKMSTDVNYKMMDCILKNKDRMSAKIDARKISKISCCVAMNNSKVVRICGTRREDMSGLEESWLAWCAAWTAESCENCAKEYDCVDSVNEPDANVRGMHLFNSYWTGWDETKKISNETSSGPAKAIWASIKACECFMLSHCINEELVKNRYEREHEIFSERVIEILSKARGGR